MRPAFQSRTWRSPGTAEIPVRVGHRYDLTASVIRATGVSHGVNQVSGAPRACSLMSTAARAAAAVQRPVLLPPTRCERSLCTRWIPREFSDRTVKMDAGAGHLLNPSGSDPRGAYTPRAASRGIVSDSNRADSSVVHGCL